MANVRTRGTDKVKVVSAVITLVVIVALVFGIFSVAQNVRKSKNNNLVNLNETEGNVAIKTDDDPDIEEHQRHLHPNIAAAAMEVKRLETIIYKATGDV